MTDAKQIVLAQRPQGMPKPSDFRVESVPMPKPEHGQALVRVIYLSIDPYMRGRISGVASYAKGVDPGDVMVGGCVGQVVEAKGSQLKPGDFVEGPMGWRSHAVLPANLLRRLDPAAAPISTANGVLGMPGMTAYFALLDVCQPRAGDTVVVSAASGAVGQVVGQIAKIAGCRVVGIAGGARKCAFVREELGFDAAVDYKAEKDLGAALKAAAPNGVDVYFDNVGGEIHDTVMTQIRLNARIVVCGTISTYNNKPGEGDIGPRQLRRLLVNRARIQGFLVWDYNQRYPEGMARIAQWIKEGRIKYREDFVDGLEKAPHALIAVLEGGNFGKMNVRVSADPTR
ncbi:MAG: NADP-dependent oxidoreductase [Alphaproteobacteria bacterium]|nr:NADP-dependent oxidoreductase [Alphaproteobacteria bacterium]